MTAKRLKKAGKGRNKPKIKDLRSGIASLRHLDKETSIALGCRRQISLKDELTFKWTRRKIGNAFCQAHFTNTVKSVHI
jgi:hypothetical protein